LQACSEPVPEAPETPVETEEDIAFNPMFNDEWIGLGISYGSYRDGESPDQDSVSSEEDILEDMLILTDSGKYQWNLIRMYAADAASEQVLKTIRKHKLPVKVMQGAWLSSKEDEGHNEQQLSEIIRLANEYSDIIVAVNLGNEIFVDWSYHGFAPDEIPMYVEWVNRVKAAVSVPVTLADDYNFYNKPWAKPVVEALDFMVLHAYAMWNSQTLENAVPWTIKTFNDIQALYPDTQIVLGEAGWASSSISTNGDERLIIAQASEKAQLTFFLEYRAWLKENRIANFYFEAFDEKWKGGEDKPDGIAEKNWGIYFSDRTPKLVVKP
jgi:exo-beta-1,3-glucanase (GH17 family)